MLPLLSVELKIKNTDATIPTIPTSSTIIKKRTVNYAKSKKTVNIKLNHHGVQGIQYNLDDLNINNYVLSEDESLEKDGYLFKY